MRRWRDWRKSSRQAIAFRRYYKLLRSLIINLASAPKEAAPPNAPSIPAVAPASKAPLSVPAPALSPLAPAVPLNPASMAKPDIIIPKEAKVEA